MHWGLRFVFGTDDGLGGLIARLFLGIVMLPHGVPNLLDFDRAMAGLTAGVGISSSVAFLVIIGESFGAAALILGFMSRFCALSIATIMVGAIWTLHLSHGFFMNWGDTKAGEGYEYHLLAIGLALFVAVCGGGRISLDGLLARRYLISR